jgi:hypothetical protein
VNGLDLVTWAGGLPFTIQEPILVKGSHGVATKVNPRQYSSEVESIQTIRHPYGII